MQLIHPNGTTLTLSDDLLWSDEFEWSSLAQTEPERTLTGSYIIQQGIKRAGRPITLAPPDKQMAWHTRAVAETVQAWSELPETQFTLIMRDVRYKVVFVSVSASPVLGFGGTEAGDYFLLELRLLTA